MNRSTIAVAALAGLLALPLVAPKPSAAQEASTMATTTLKVGDVAPNFTLPSDQRKPVTLADYRGKKNVMLAFYVLAFTGG
jgi:cytochrome oxidase Cu insertion factor (SCO1/SenC/PrrC family)